MQSFFHLISKYIYKNIFNFLKYDFSEYIPNSKGSPFVINRLIKENIKNHTKNLLEISEWFNKVEVKNLRDLESDEKTVYSLNNLFEKYGSDKNKHGYDFLYAYLFSKISKTPRILEIGIGTNNENIASNMGGKGKPGASLKAFSDYFPNSEIYGADVDTNILFNSGNIKTFYLDQNNIESFHNVKIENKHFDLIIDDGLHMQSANLNTIRFALQKLKLGGLLVIEDIPTSALGTWKIINNLVKKPFNLEIIKCTDNYVVVLSLQK